MAAVFGHRMRLFGILMGAVVALGLPFVLNISVSLTQALYAVGVLLASAAVIAGGIEIFLLRPNRPFRSETAPEPVAAALGRAVEYSDDAHGWSLALLRRLEWRRFEEVCAAYFEALGFASKRGRVAAGGGADIDLYAEGGENRSILLRCKAGNSNTVGIKPVRELRAAMTAESVGEGVLVTSGQFTREAKDFAAKENIALVSGVELLKNIVALAPEKAAALLELATRGDFETPTCPSCAVKMVARTSTDGGRKFWGCHNYPLCKETFFSTHNAPI